MAADQGPNNRITHYMVMAPLRRTDRDRAALHPLPGRRQIGAP
jgi:hypothetical protein